MIYQRLGRTYLAVKFFEESVRTDPGFYKAIFMIAEFHYAQADFTEALRRFEEAHRVSPEAADTLGLEPLVEVHTEGELKVALRVGARVIGINHRDLRTFEFDATLTERLIPKIPSRKIIVAESGIQRAEDVARMRTLGAHALLIGEALMRAPDPAAKVAELFAGTW